MVLLILSNLRKNNSGSFSGFNTTEGRCAGRKENIVTADCVEDINTGIHNRRKSDSQSVDVWC